MKYSNAALLFAFSALLGVNSVILQKSNAALSPQLARSPLKYSNAFFRLAGAEAAFSPQLLGHLFALDELADRFVEDFRLLPMRPEAGFRKNFKLCAGNQRGETLSGIGTGSAAAV